MSKLIESQLKGLQREKIASKSIARHAMAFVVTTMDEAIDLANEVAAEHLTLSVDNPFDYLEKVRHAGALFLGRYHAAVCSGLHCRAEPHVARQAGPRGFSRPCPSMTM